MQGHTAAEEERTHGRGWRTSYFMPAQADRCAFIRTSGCVILLTLPARCRVHACALPCSYGLRLREAQRGAGCMPCWALRSAQTACMRKWSACCAQVCGAVPQVA